MSGVCYRPTRDRISLKCRCTLDVDREQKGNVGIPQTSSDAGSTFTAYNEIAENKGNSKTKAV